MSGIDRHNYEAFYLDYLEGTLSTEKTAELLLFLEKNKDLELELEELDMTRDADIALPTLGAGFGKKENFASLKKTINASNVEDYIIGDLEKELYEDDRRELCDYLDNNEEASILSNRYQKTILPTNLIEYPNKSSLKRKIGVFIPMKPLLRIAAVGLLLIALIPFFTKDPRRQIADNTTPKELNTPDSSTSKSQNEVNTLPIENQNESSFDQTIEKMDFKATELEVRDAHKVEKIDEIGENVPSDPVRENIKSMPRSFQSNLFAESFTSRVLSSISNQEEANDEGVLLANDGSHKPSLGEWVNTNIRKRVFKEDTPNRENIKGHEILELASETIQKNTKTNVAFSYNESKQRSSYSLTIGKFSISKSKGN